MLGALISIGGALVSAFGKKKAADANKEAAKLNERIVRKQTASDVTQIRRAGIQGLGATRADIGHAGLAEAGSAADLIRMGERDISEAIETTQEIGDLKAKLYKMGASAAETAGQIGIASSIIGGIRDARGQGLFG